MTNISVVIPTYNRSKILFKTLKALENQNYPKSNYEVIIVDGGSTNPTELIIQRFIKKTFLKIKYIKLNHSLAGHARNAGVKYANNELILFIDDDIIPTPNFIDEHIKSHALANFKNNFAVLGFTIWPPEWKTSSFMRYIIEDGPQFGYRLITDESDLPFLYFYSSNISINRDFLLKGTMFDERLRYYDDIELGFRLKKRGLRIILNKKAIAYHFHPTTIFSFMKRQKLVGFYAVLFNLKHPDMKDWLFPRDNQDTFWKDLIFKIILRFRKIPILDIKNRLFSNFLKYSYNIGFKKGLIKFGRPKKIGC